MASPKMVGRSFSTIVCCMAPKSSRYNCRSSLPLSSINWSKMSTATPSYHHACQKFGDNVQILHSLIFLFFYTFPEACCICNSMLLDASVVRCSVCDRHFVGWNRDMGAAEVPGCWVIFLCLFFTCMWEKSRFYYLSGQWQFCCIEWWTWIELS